MTTSGSTPSIAAISRVCDGEQAGQEQAGLEHSPSAIADELAQRPGLTTTAPLSVDIGGFHGLVLDVRMADGWSANCSYYEGPSLPLIRGVPPSSFDHTMFAGLSIRLYLLERSGTTLAIEVDDVSGGAHLEAYSAIVEQIGFGA